jgi:hypothetical protein
VAPVAAVPVVPAGGGDTEPAVPTAPAVPAVLPAVAGAPLTGGTAGGAAAVAGGTAAGGAAAVAGGTIGAAGGTAAVAGGTVGATAADAPGAVVGITTALLSMNGDELLPGATHPVSVIVCAVWPGAGLPGVGDPAVGVCASAAPAQRHATLLSTVIFIIIFSSCPQCESVHAARRFASRFRTRRKKM